jgi:hypothetical protein
VAWENIRTFGCWDVCANYEGTAKFWLQAEKHCVFEYSFSSNAVGIVAKQVWRDQKMVPVLWKVIKLLKEWGLVCKGPSTMFQSGRAMSDPNPILMSDPNPILVSP